MWNDYYLLRNDIEFDINRPAIEKLHTNGLITWDENDNVVFWAPLYQKRLFKTFYPYTNGEKKVIQRTMPYYEIVDEQGTFQYKTIDRILQSFILKKEVFDPFEKKIRRATINPLKKAVMVYSFETYIHAFLEMVGAKSYREAQVALGNTDLIINDVGKKYLIETKIYRYDKQFQNGKKAVGLLC